MKCIINFIKKYFSAGISANNDVELEKFALSNTANKYEYPYVINIKNTSNKKQKVILFNVENDLTNLNDKSIEITDLTDETAIGISRYKEALKTLKDKHIEIGKWRFTSENKYNLLEPIFIINKSEGMLDCFINKIPLKISELLDAYQFQSYLRESRQLAFIDNETTIEIQIQPNSEMTINMYPLIINDKNSENAN